jgi:tetratricopeptide (TPR) repeat protein
MSQGGALLWLKLQAMAQLTLGRQQAAMACFDRMLALDANHAYALSSRAHLRAQLEDRKGALQDYARLTALPQAQAADFFNQGFLQEVAGQLEAAEASFRQAIALNEQLDRAWFGLGLVLIRQARLDEAITALKRNTQLQPMSPYAWCELARIHAKRQEPEEAAKIIRHLRGFEPKVAAQLARETGINVKASPV